MDERSPRQPDSSGPPEASHEPPAHPPRPGNPYRIPQRTQGPPPEEAAAPSAPVPPPQPDPPQRSAGSWDSPASWDEPPRAGAADDGWGAPSAHAWEPSRHGDSGAHGSAGRPQEPASWDEPPRAPDRGGAEDWNAPYPSAQGPSGGWDAPRGGGAHDSWDDDPYPGQPVHHGGTPYPGGPHDPAPDRGGRGETGPQHGQGSPDGFEYLYSGGGPGAGGPDDPDRHGDDGYAPGPPPRKSRRGLLIGVLSAVVVLLLVGGGASWYVLTMPEPEEAAAEYEAAWEAQDYERLAAVTRGGDAAAVLGGIDSGLGVDSIAVEVGTVTADGGAGSAPYEVTVSLTNADDWGWEGELPLVREDGEWWVEFSPEVAYPGLGEGQVLARTAVWGERGSVLAADGTVLDGTVSGSLQMIAGSLGEATAEDVERLGPAYSVGDTVGVSGLQRTYEERLAGEAATTVLMVDAAAAEDPDSLEATAENTVATLDGADGEDVVTSIDMAVQNAASNAVIDSADPVGLVAVRPSTGEILAAANVPGGFNRAFEGQYPPGSSFKIITYSSLLDNGMGMDATLNCPKEYDLGGWPFVNAGDAEYGAQTVTEAFATSCNTALVEQVGDRLSSDTLQASAEQFGMNAPLDIGVPTLEPSFPPVDSATMLGAQSIGQGQILTSPLHMSTVPAAVADGSWRHPVLVTEPAQEGLPEPRAIAQAEALRTMMRAVVTEGTAEDVPFQGEVYAKSGTAEFGTAEDADEDGELPSHAWMVGFKGDVAFAVVVEGGGGGSSVAGPLAASFTNGL
ncbi:penicillin-binding transpeptidase domain-containing protein [Nocardiopsis sp. HUAS JQ3]|uniref:penicillin-binding transpeptidase domain-containing protein n=1 Tax=Nocardiopsis sp. HUAS JQ3 TaxID=3061629 RepID=UPI0023A97C7A|nr:penicillin-binding transpeptidase domain-containing protein [Nocardiopsis sp. HUAS JQ3]WDZ88695.1 penicillin-binding transpeptidase domain-containing protein [Nocardiopsis sp. HUAS JQ3]